MTKPMREGIAITSSAILAFALTFLPLILIQAGRPGRVDVPEDGSRLDVAMLEHESRRLAGLKLPPAFPSLAEFAPFGRLLTARVLQGDAAKGKLLTNLGHAEWDEERDDLLALVPPRLRLGPGEVSRSAQGALRAGLNFVALDEPILRREGPDALLRAVGEHARIVGFLPGATLVIYLEPISLEGLRRVPGIARTRPYEPYHKIALDFGVRPHINRAEAANPDIQANVRVVPGLDGPAVLARLRAIRGVSEVTQDAAERAGYRLRVRYSALENLARVDEVMWIGPVYEFMLSNAENAPSVQMGSWEDGLGIRPFDDAGVDGGGIDTNADGQRVNNGSDTVPPQIVGVIDNGISADTPSFSQTATQVSDLTHPFPNPVHRKVHSIISSATTATTATRCSTAPAATATSWRAPSRLGRAGSGCSRPGPASAAPDSRVMSTSTAWPRGHASSCRTWPAMVSARSTP